MATLTVNLPFQIIEKNGVFVSSCPPLDLVTQGENKKQAMSNLVEVTQLFLLSCFGRGVLEKVLVDCGFEPDFTSDIQDTDSLETMEVPLPLLISKEANAKAALC